MSRMLDNLIGFVEGVKRLRESEDYSMEWLTGDGRRALGVRLGHAECDAIVSKLHEVFTAEVTRYWFASHPSTEEIAATMRAIGAPTIAVTDSGPERTSS